MGPGLKPPLRELRIGIDLDPHALPDDTIAFLRLLGGPTLLHLEGRDASRTRVVTTLLHGNEPSGLRAVLRHLRAGTRPETNVLFFVGAVATALEPPGFAWRALPGEVDANRCWLATAHGPAAAVAAEVLERIFDVSPECLVDLHNNTGHNPAYGVAFSLGHAEKSLVSLFADRVVHTPLHLGTIVEATVPHFPSVTIECGRAGDPEADAIARSGLERFVGWESIDFERPIQPLAVYEDPIRVLVREGSDVVFAGDADANVPLTISGTIDRHNFETLAAGTQIGWVAEDSDWPLEARDARGRECSRDLFSNDGGVLRTTQERIPIMMTTNPEIALADCLFYSVRLS